MNAPQLSQITEENAPSKLTKRLNLAGLAITSVWLLLMMSYAVTVRDALLEMKPNEFGDLLAGTFAPLAFLWLVLGFFQQGEELRNSSRALWLQGEELRNSVEQQRQLVETTREQLQFEREMLNHERAELARTSAPILKLATGGNSGTGDGRRKYEFRVTNVGKRCTGVRLHFEAKDSMAGDIHWNSLDTGHTNEFSYIFWPAEDIEFLVVIDYLDERMMPGSKHFHVKKHSNRFEIQDLAE